MYNNCISELLFFNIYVYIIKVNCFFLIGRLKSWFKNLFGIRKFIKRYLCFCLDIICRRKVGW